MNVLKTVIAAAVMSVAVLPAVYAANKPTTCPTIPLIQKAGLYFTEHDPKNHMYLVAQINRYNTPQTWAFAFLLKEDEATSKQDAFNKAKEALSTLSGSPEPLPITEDAAKQQWYCWYENKYHYMSVAITPLSVSSNNFASFMSKK